MTLVAISWDDAAGTDGRGAIRLIDQTRLPGERVDLVIDTTAALVSAIDSLAVRGAPALGVAGALGVVLALDEGAREGWSEAEIDRAIDAVRAARPTAVNLAWGVDQVRGVIPRGRDEVLAAARRLAAEDEAANRRLSSLAADWIVQAVPRDTIRVLTHCNTGALATSAWGTALGVVRELWDRGVLEMVYVDETRPLLQGSRLTAFELAEAGIPYVIQVDSAAASTAMRGLVDVAIVGSDRIAANGDVANKIGTLGVALAAHAAGIPFVVAAPASTVDRECPDGSAIEIEERDGAEVLATAGPPVAPAGARAINPAFDVTPARYVDAIATEAGVVHPDGTSELFGV